MPLLASGARITSLRGVQHGAPLRIGCLVTGNDWLAVFGALGFASLVPVIWAIVDVTRRPPWQFSTGRKVLWALTLSVGWIILWPIALVSSLLYLFVLRRRFPGATSSTPGVGQPPYGYGSHLGGGWPPYGTPPYGTPHSGGQGYGGQPYGGPSGSQPQGGPYGGQEGPPTYGSYGSYGYPPNVPPGPPQPLPPAGWYPDPAGSHQQRWWDGRGWSDHLRSEPS